VIRHVEIGDDMRAFAEILGELGVELVYVAGGPSGTPGKSSGVAISLTVGLGALTTARTFHHQFLEKSVASRPRIFLISVRSRFPDGRGPLPRFAAATA